MFLPCSFAKEHGYAAIAHLVERHLAKVEVASSSLVGRSTKRQNRPRAGFGIYGDVAKW